MREFEQQISKEGLKKHKMASRGRNWTGGEVKLFCQ